MHVSFVKKCSRRFYQLSQHDKVHMQDRGSEWALSVRAQLLLPDECIEIAALQSSADCLCCDTEDHVVDISALVSLCFLQH